MASFILSLDQGTTSSRAIVFDQSGSILGIGQKEFTQYFPKPGWVEHDPMEIWSSQISVIAEAMSRAGIHAAQIAAIGITNQRETTVVWNRASGKPIYPAIVWQDRRTAEFCEQLKKEGREPLIRQKTGLVADAYFSATKLKWILDEVPGAKAQARAGELAFGTIDTWLLWNLSAGKLHLTDTSNASRTLLYNIHQLDWDEELLDLMDIPVSILPQVRDSSGLFGYTDPRLFSASIPVTGIAGDQQAALFGQQCSSPGMVKNTYGTGCFLVMNTGSQAVPSRNNLLTTLAWKIGPDIQYALEGSIFIGGAVVQWLRDGLQIIPSSSAVEALSLEVPDNGGVYFVPAFAGLGAPHWNPRARGTLVGLSRGTGRAHIARAALESIAFQTTEVLRCMESDAGMPIRELRVDGGAASNDLLMQFQSDLLGVPVIRPTITETTALGAAYLAGLAIGYWTDTRQISKQWQIEHTFQPAIEPGKKRQLLRQWDRAVATAKTWADWNESASPGPEPDIVRQDEPDQ